MLAGRPPAASVNAVVRPQEGFEVEVASLIEEAKRVYSAACLDCGEGLLPPASDADIDAIGEQLGLPVPPELRELYQTHGGQDVPVIYLPGIGRAAFRSADQCPHQAKHMFALQFQGQFWTQKNGKDWTPFAFLLSADGGLGLDVAADSRNQKSHPGMSAGVVGR